MFNSFIRFYFYIIRVFRLVLFYVAHVLHSPSSGSIILLSSFARLHIALIFTRVVVSSAALQMSLASPCCPRPPTDGSDHRRCCAKKIVPTRCLDWCRGEPVAMVEECSLGHAKEIVDCFEEGKSTLTAATGRRARLGGGGGLARQSYC